MKYVLALLISTITATFTAHARQAPVRGETGFQSKEEYRRSILDRTFASVFSVTDSTDAPDDSLGDGIYYPPTLRSAIQNANLTPGPHLIELNSSLPAYLQPLSALPLITSRVAIVGHDLGLDGTLAGSSTRALYFSANNCLVTDLHIRNFGGGGIQLSGYNDTISGVEITACGGSGINMNNANGCMIGGKGIYIRNTITHLTGTGGYGISMIVNSNNNLVEGNFIGNDGIDSLPNSRVGIIIEGHGNVIRGNTISGNAYGGIELDNFLSSANVIENNYIGTDQGGTQPIPYQPYGINLLESYNDTIRNNVISGGNDRGISISSPVSGTYISGNLIGVDTTGADTLENSGAGITSSGSNVTITGNTISGNVGGVALFQGSATVVGNMIGTDRTGTKLLWNWGNGVSISGSGHVVGGFLASERNIISGNGTGVRSSSGSGSVVQGNYIGTDVTGTMPFPNGTGVVIRQQTNGLRVITNVISGNIFDGISVVKSSIFTPVNNVIAGNYIGLGANGQDTIPNGWDGIYMQTTRFDTVGGPDSLDANFIGSNKGYGIHLVGDSTDHITIFNNRIGVGWGDVPRPNLAGIVIDSAWGNSIGAVPYADPGNTIANNAGDGVRVTGTAAMNAIRYNSIFDNDSLGVDLGDDGVTMNDAGDADAGPNGLANFPVLLLVQADTANTRLIGDLDAVPLQPYSIDFYSSDTCDPSGYGEGKRYLGTGEVIADSAGAARFDVTVPSRPGMFFTAIATDTFNNSSEFSKCTMALPPGPWADVGVEVSDTVDSAEPGDTVDIFIDVGNLGPDTATGVHTIDSLAGAQLLDDTATAGSVTINGNALEWDIPVLPPGESARLTARVRIDTADTVRSWAEVSASTPDPDAGNDTDADSIFIGPPTAVGEDPGPGTPSAYHLAQNYPNPFNPATEINFDLPRSGLVRLVVYDLLGREVARLVDGPVPAGRHRVRWNASGTHSGVYFYRLTSGMYSETKKMMLLK